MCHKTTVALKLDAVSTRRDTAGACVLRNSICQKEA